MNQLARINAISGPRDYSGAQLQLIRHTLAKDTTDNEFDMFMEICRRQQLDPFKRQIYALVFNKDKADKRQVAFITGIDGYRAIAKRAGNYRPDENEPEITYDKEAIDPLTNPKGIVKAVVTVNQYAEGAWHPVRAVAHWEEFAPLGDEWVDGKRTGKKKLAKENWRTMPQVMISKCAEAQALRRGWPEDMGGIYIQEEMDRAVTDMTASEAVEQHEQDERMQRIGGTNAYPMIFNFTTGLDMVPHGQMADRILEHIGQLTTVTDIEMWREANRAGLRQFWAKNPSEADAVKRLIDARIMQLDQIPDFQPHD